MFALLAGAALVGQQGGAPPPAPSPPGAPQSPAPAPSAPPVQPAAVGADGVQRPTFRAQIDYVEVSAIVTDDDGNLVHRPAKSDFEILENGKPQTVSVFTPVKIPFERPPTDADRGTAAEVRRGQQRGRARRTRLRDRARRLPYRVAAHGAGQDRRQGIHREARRGQRPGRGHPRQRPQQRVAGVHDQQGPDARGGRQADGHEDPIGHASSGCRTTVPASSN